MSVHVPDSRDVGTQVSSVERREEQALAAVMAGCRSRQQVAEATNMPEPEAYAALTKLLLNGLVNMRVATDPTPHWEYRPTGKARRRAGGRDIRLTAGVSYEPGDVDTVRHAKVYDAPDMPDNLAGNPNSLMRPRRVEIILQNETVKSVCVYGPSVRKDGSIGSPTEVFRYFAGEPQARNPEPAWLINLITDQELLWPGRTDVVGAVVPAAEVAS